MPTEQLVLPGVIKTLEEQIEANLESALIRYQGDLHSYFRDLADISSANSDNDEAPSTPSSELTDFVSFCVFRPEDGN